MNDKLVRLQDDRVLGGVCGGLGRYFGVDSTLVRIGFVLFTLAGGAGILAYLVLLFLMPLDSTAGAGINVSGSDQKRRTTLLVGAGLVLVGIWSLLGQTHIFSWLDFRYMFPLILVALGIGLIVRRDKGLL